MAWVTPSKNNQDHLVTGGEDGHVVIWTRVLDAKSDLHKVAVRTGPLWWWGVRVRGGWAGGAEGGRWWVVRWWWW